MRSVLKGLVAGVCFMAVAGQANAATVTGILNVISDPNIGSGSLGTVTVTDISGGVMVDVKLISGINFINTGNGSNHKPFSYNLNTSPGTITFVNSAVFSASGSTSISGFGPFTNNVNMVGGNGAPDSQHGPLDFTILGVTTANFVKNTSNYFFAADLLNVSNGKTGEVGVSSITTAVPEPSTWAMLILGFAGVGFMAYRRTLGGNFRTA